MTRVAATASCSARPTEELYLLWRCLLRAATYYLRLTASLSPQSTALRSGSAATLR